MRYVVCAVRDAKVQAFTPPFFMRTRGEAERAFINAVGDASQNPMLYNHPADFQCYVLGHWDDATGAFESMSPELLLSGGDAVSVRTEA